MSSLQSPSFGSLLKALRQWRSSILITTPLASPVRRSRRAHGCRLLREIPGEISPPDSKTSDIAGAKHGYRTLIILPRSHDSKPVLGQRRGAGRWNRRPFNTATNLLASSRPRACTQTMAEHCLFSSLARGHPTAEAKAICGWVSTHLAVTDTLKQAQGIAQWLPGRSVVHRASRLFSTPPKGHVRKGEPGCGGRNAR